MRKRIYIIIATTLALTCLACNRPKQKSVAPVKIIEQVKVKVASPIDYLPIPTGDSVMLSKQLLTGSNGFDHAFGYDIEYEGYYEEATKPEETFYFPSEDLRRKNPDLVATVQQSWNCASLLIRVIHAYELFLRASTDFDDEYKLDTLGFIKKYAPRFSDKFLARAFPNADT